MIAPAETVAAVPAELKAEEAAPLIYAGITIFYALRNSGAKPRELVAVLGLAEKTQLR
jgi:propanol-preferring alcohol dehydrogenase